MKESEQLKKLIEAIEPYSGVRPDREEYSGDTWRRQTTQQDIIDDIEPQCEHIMTYYKDLDPKDQVRLSKALHKISDRFKL